MEHRGALAELVAFVPPPRQPEFGTSDWDQAFEVLGLGLPADYIAFAEVYGQVKLFTTDKFWLARPPTTSTNAELWQRAFPHGDPADNPYL